MLCCDLVCACVLFVGMGCSQAPAECCPVCCAKKSVIFF